MLGPEEEKEFGRRVQNGDREARRQLIECNLRLVVTVAKKYRGYGLPFEDLIQEGNIGLMKAVEKFDPERGYRFSTYAFWWIRQIIQRSVINQSATIRVPVHMAEKIRALSRIRRQLTLESGREPTEEELATELGWDLEELRSVAASDPKLVSLDQTVSAEEGSSVFEEFIEDGRDSDIGGTVVQTVENDLVRATIDQLSYRPRHILVRRYGLDGRKPAPLAELARELGLSRTRVGQLQRDAENILRSRLMTRRGALALVPVPDRQERPVLAPPEYREL